MSEGCSHHFENTGLDGLIEAVRKRTNSIQEDEPWVVSRLDQLSTEVREKLAGFGIDADDPQQMRMVWAGIALCFVSREGFVVAKTTELPPLLQRPYYQELNATLDGFLLTVGAYLSGFEVATAP